MLLLKRLFRRPLTSSEAHQATLHNVQSPPLPNDWRDFCAGLVGTKGVSLLDWWRQAFGSVLDEITSKKTWEQQRAALLNVTMQQEQWSNLCAVAKDKPVETWRHFVAGADEFKNAPETVWPLLLLQKWMTAILTSACLMEFGIKYFGVDKIKELEVKALGEFEKEIMNLDVSITEMMHQSILNYEDENALMIADFKDTSVNPLIQEQWRLANIMREQITNTSLDVWSVKGKMQDLQSKKDDLAALITAH